MILAIFFSLTLPDLGVLLNKEKWSLHFDMKFIPSPAVLCQTGAEMIEYNGIKYLKFQNPCKADDTYCPLTCSQKYQPDDKTENGLCVSCVCEHGHGGLAHPTDATTATTTKALKSTTARYSIVIQQGEIYLKLANPCNTSQPLCSASCYVDLLQYGEDEMFSCEVCNCSSVTTTSGMSTQTTQTTSDISSAPVTTPTTTLSKEVVLIGGVPNLLVDLPCTPSDNVCPVSGCTADGVVRDSGLCFQCECSQTTSKGTISTTFSTTPSTTTASELRNGDTVDVGGILHVVVSNPCRSHDNLCPVTGCTVDLTMTGSHICFECRCVTTKEPTTETPTTSTSQPTTTTVRDALQTIVVGGKEYKLLQKPCTPKDNLCPSDDCQVEAHVSPNRSLCFSCEC